MLSMKTIVSYGFTDSIALLLQGAIEIHLLCLVSDILITHLMLCLYYVQ